MQLFRQQRLSLVLVLIKESSEIKGKLPVECTAELVTTKERLTSRDLGDYLSSHSFSLCVNQPIIDFRVSSLTFLSRNFPLIIGSTALSLPIFFSMPWQSFASSSHSNMEQIFPPIPHELILTCVLRACTRPEYFDP